MFEKLIRSKPVEPPPPPPPPVGVLDLCGQLERAYREREQLTRQTLRLERYTHDATSDLERASRISKADRSIDHGFNLEELREQAERFEAELKLHYIRIQGADGKVAELEQKITATADLDALQGEINARAERIHTLERQYQDRIIERLAGVVNTNGNEEAARLELKLAEIDRDRTAHVVELARSLVRAKQIREAVTEALPCIKGLIDQEVQALDSAIETDRGLTAEFERLRDVHGFNLPWGWMPEEFVKAKERLSNALQHLRELIK